MNAPVDTDEGGAIDMFDGIVQDWERWVASPRARRRLGDWGRRHPAAAGWGLAALRSPRSSLATDGLQAALVALAQEGDEDAARTLIVQLRPGLVGLVWWTARAGAGPLASAGCLREAEREVLSAFGETLISHRLDRRPNRIAANLLLDTRQRLWRATQRERKLVAAARATVTGATDARATAVGPAGRATAADREAGAQHPARHDPADRVPADRVPAHQMVTPSGPDGCDGALDLVAALEAALEDLAAASDQERVTAQAAYRAWVLDEPTVAIARDLGLRRKTVDTRLCRLRTSLRAVWDADADPAPTQRRATRRSDGSAPLSSPVGPSWDNRQ